MHLAVCTTRKLCRRTCKQTSTLLIRRTNRATQSASALVLLPTTCFGVGNVMGLSWIGVPVCILYSPIHCYINSLINHDTGRDPHAYLRAIGTKELESTRRFGKPLENEFPHGDMLEGKIAPEANIELFDKYLALSSYLLPKSRDNLLNRPTLRHPGMYRRRLVAWRLSAN